jgi:hypothetical protein
VAKKGNGWLSREMGAYYGDGWLSREMGGSVVTTPANYGSSLGSNSDISHNKNWWPTNSSQPK